MTKNEALSLSSRSEAIADSGSTTPLHPVLCFAAASFFVVNVGILLSLPPVLRGRGAPYLPTFAKNADAMFQQVKRLQNKKQQKASFVDLGSGDGRLVFRAAREGFYHCIGYEINPLLHLSALIQQWFQPHYWKSTEFHCRDIWKVDLTDVDVVAVYGLGPIMKDLGRKLQKELPPGALVVSNVFTIPGWTPADSSSVEGTHIYRVPPNQDHITYSPTATPQNME